MKSSTLVPTEATANAALDKHHAEATIQQHYWKARVEKLEQWRQQLLAGKLTGGQVLGFLDKIGPGS